MYLTEETPWQQSPGNYSNSPNKKTDKKTFFCFWKQMLINVMQWDDHKFLILNFFKVYECFFQLNLSDEKSPNEYCLFDEFDFYKLVKILNSGFFLFIILPGNQLMNYPDRDYFWPVSISQWKTFDYYN